MKANRDRTLDIVCAQAVRIWDSMAYIHHRLKRYEIPEIYLCGRLTSTAGKCYQEDRRIHLGWKFFQHSSEYRDIMLNEILPHELMHQIDFDLFGESEKPCGHGKNWQMLMLQYGIKPNKFHTMDIKK